ncbi:PQQ-binding-like beta-propeller repeat protein [Aureliella helgolandensis]|uniref:Outer membrane biogenesis protein BamB n=1 Tax=Aureliella helgolandensis TaxID=2527968 RepID=A0A518G842_9BACT|nr:PQQ-binding-like beta-propeller repeat protein [Aureliella helgolandensis]QDV24757.1 outer membrane biogenesis protein BamB [Aureliella helgolandensis]
MIPSRRSLSALSWAVSLCVATIPIGFAQDWPQWRGAERDGKSPATGLLDRWPAEGPTLLWRANDLGNGYSTPSAANGIVYLLCSSDGKQEQLVALSLRDGKRLWATRIGEVGENRGPQYPGTRSTPTVDGESVYALASGGNLVCLDSQSGTINWSKSLPGDLGGKPGAWAYSESPLIDGDALICSPGGSEATVVALQKKDGAVIWNAQIEQGDEASYSSPIIANIHGTKQYVLFLSKGTLGLNAKTGALLWRYDRTADKQANVQTPVASNTFIYTAASRVGGGLIELSANASDPQEVYFAKAMPSGMGGSVLVDGKLYGSSGSTLMCIDFATGDIQWQDRSIGSSSLCYADGKLYLHGDSNEVAMVAASSDGYQELGRFPPPNAPDHGTAKAWTYPIIADGKLLIRDVGSVWCYDLKK